MTDSMKALGQWPNAPLALVLAQVRFEPSAHTQWAVLEQKMRAATASEFPLVDKIQEFALVIGDGGNPVSKPEPSVAGVDLRSSDGMRCVRLGSGVITYTTSVYEDSVCFAEEWRKILDILCAQGPVKAFRLGLRYVDFIIPAEGRVPEDYVAQGFGRSPDVLGEQSPVAFSLYEYARQEDGGRLRIQYGRGFGPPALPPDVSDTVPPPPFLVAKYGSGLSAVLDIDRWRPLSAMVEAAEISSAFQALKYDVGNAFRCIISPLALTEWKGSPSEGE